MGYTSNGIGCQLVSKRFVFAAPVLAVVFAFFGLSYSSYAWVSLQAGSLPFFWQNSTVTFAINATGHPTITDDSEVAAVRLGFEAWKKIPSSRVDFIEDTSAASRARTDWRSDDLHTVLWDMDNESGFFGAGSGLVAITPVDFNPTTGQIIDADILFNGSKAFSTSGEGGKFDVQNIATHEVGHFIGLDHSAVVGATMNPFANTADTRLRSLEPDDVAAAASIYPIGGEPGAIQGYVKLNGVGVSGAHVVAEDVNGVPASATLSDATGFFKIRGLDQGTYAVYAEPLDGPVTNANFSLHTSGLTIDTNFGTTFYGATGRSSPASPERVNVTFGATTDLNLIDLLAKNTMNVTSIGATSIAPNTELVLNVYGANLDKANSVVVPGPPGDALFVSNPSFKKTSVSMEVSLGPSALAQLRSVRVFDSTTLACCVLTGGFEVRNPAPTMTGISPTTGQAGVQVTVSGAKFEPGARVVLGGYVVTASGFGAELRFSVPNAPAGKYSVAVENPDGQFVKLSNAFTVEASSSGGSSSSNSSSSQPTPQASQPTVSATPTASGGSSSAPAPISGSSGGGGGGGGGGCALGIHDQPLGHLPTSLAMILLVGSLLSWRRREALATAR
ncbi:MAG: matrixin family metalloprotease [Planctomycetota bacterium]